MKSINEIKPLKDKSWENIIDTMLAELSTPPPEYEFANLPMSRFGLLKVSISIMEMIMDMYVRFPLLNGLGTKEEFSLAWGTKMYQLQRDLHEIVSTETKDDSIRFAEPMAKLSAMGLVLSVFGIFIGKSEDEIDRIKTDFLDMLKNEVKLRSESDDMDVLYDVTEFVMKDASEEAKNTIEQIKDDLMNHDLNLTDEDVQILENAMREKKHSCAESGKQITKEEFVSTVKNTIEFIKAGKNGNNTVQ